MTRRLLKLDSADIGILFIVDRDGPPGHKSANAARCICRSDHRQIILHRDRALRAPWRIARTRCTALQMAAAALPFSGAAGDEHPALWASRDHAWGRWLRSSLMIGFRPLRDALVAEVNRRTGRLCRRLKATRQAHAGGPWPASPRAVGAGIRVFEAQFPSRRAAHPRDPGSEGVMSTPSAPRWRRDCHTRLPRTRPARPGPPPEQSRRLEAAAAAVGIGRQLLHLLHLEVTFTSNI